MANPTRGGGLRSPTVIRGFDDNGVERVYTGTDIREIVFNDTLVTTLDTSVTPPRLVVGVRPPLPA
jgi:hypothetical protein